MHTFLNSINIVNCYVANVRYWPLIVAFEAFLSFDHAVIVLKTYFRFREILARNR
jgi:hypothetical protein